MKLLCLSWEFGEVEGLVKRLVCVGIPCGVSKDSGNSQLGVWIQQDEDFPLALRIFANRPAPRRLPHWACVLHSPPAAIPESAVPATPAPASRAPKAVNRASMVVVQSKGPTQTGTVSETTLQREPQPR